MFPSPARVAWDGADLHARCGCVGRRTPAAAQPVAGVTMAGFRVRRPWTSLRVVPHPAVTLFLEFGAGSPVVDGAAGRQQRGSFVAGPGLGSGGAVRARGENVECVQIRLSPVIARAVLGASPADLDGAVVALDDLWGREASRIRERLAAILVVGRLASR